MKYLPLKVMALGAAMLAGCNALTGVNDLEVVEGASDAGGSSGTGGGGSGGGTGGAAGSGDCEPGQKLCNGACVPVDAPAFGCSTTSCEPCYFENAKATCSDSVCEFAGCNDGWIDCDENVGCETPVHDDNECTDDLCGHPPKDVGAPCNDNGGTQCDGNGNCIGCAEHDLRCDGNQPQTCSAEGTWNNLAECQAPTPACSNGYCASVSSVVTGGGHSCALLSNSTVRCWGDNARGQLGNGQMGGIEPTPVVNLSYSADALFAGARHTCAVNDVGLHCWGANDDGQIGNDVFGGEQLGPMQVSGLTNVQFAALGSNFTCAYAELGSTMGVYCWGAASKGQLGNGNLTNTNAPTTRIQLAATGAVLSLSAGESHACLVKEPGEIYCWGNNADGQVGSSPSAQEVTPWQAIPDIGLSVAAGGWHTCALTMGGVSCWGADSSGQVGDGPPAAVRQDAVLIADNAAGFEKITAGGQHTCGLANGDVLCWGRNNHGQLGIGGVASELAPVTLTGLPSVAGALSAGGAAGTASTDPPPRAHTCARASDGNVWCWGANDAGQLGNGNTNTFEVPVQVKW